jgi:hypothetical protein
VRKIEGATVEYWVWWEDSREVGRRGEAALGFADAWIFIALSVRSLDSAGMLDPETRDLALALAQDRSAKAATNRKIRRAALSVK